MDWEEAARRLEPGIDFSRIPRSVRGRLDSVESLYVACSGGADSVFALMLVFLYLKNSDRLGSLRVLHFNHGLRGDASDGDAEFAKELCDGLSIPFLDAKADWAVALDKVTEAIGREARLGFFRKATGASAATPAWVVTGHHADDVAETMLMRLSRGSGLEGLTAPREVSKAGGGIHFLRPLLGFTRKEIQSTLEGCGISWREDATNDSDRNYRARLRKSVIPSWDLAADRPARLGVSRSRSLLAEDAEALDAWTDRVWESAWDQDLGALATTEVATVPVALQRRVLHRLVGGVELGAKAIEACLEALAGGTRLKIEISAGVFLEFSESTIQCVRESSGMSGGAWGAFRLPLGSVAYLPDGARLAFEQISEDQSLFSKVLAGGNDDGKSAYLNDLGNTCAAVTVRRRQAGDAFKPLGKSSHKKLKTMFIDRKIDREERDRLPVFVWEGEGIVWVPGLPPSGDRRLGSRCESALRLTYER
ncbi:hypothetical protein VDG1235_3054 [Verrucomicrobiia bacterium DG1235]|nr:hypothetical protein VDG1235_3054 [Verrucomicrobiae bacterium DG1235]